jgi:hypothetical protein
MLVVILWILAYFFFLDRWNFVLSLPTLTDSLNLWMWKMNFQKRLSHPWPLSWSTTSLYISFSHFLSYFCFSLFFISVFFFYYLPQFYFILSLILFSHWCVYLFLYLFFLSILNSCSYFQECVPVYLEFKIKKISIAKSYF